MKHTDFKVGNQMDDETLQRLLGKWATVLDTMKTLAKEDLSRLEEPIFASDVAKLLRKKKVIKKEYEVITHKIDVMFKKITEAKEPEDFTVKAATALESAIEGVLAHLHKRSNRA